MNGNQFESGVLKRSNLTSYPELEHLYFSECGIETIEAGAFVDLKNLQWLDISNNRIRIIADETFRGLSLQHLFLNGKQKHTAGTQIIRRRIRHQWTLPARLLSILDQSGCPHPARDLLAIPLAQRERTGKAGTEVSSVLLTSASSSFGFESTALQLRGCLAERILRQEWRNFQRRSRPVLPGTEVPEGEIFHRTVPV